MHGMQLTRVQMTYILYRLLMTVSQAGSDRADRADRAAVSSTRTSAVRALERSTVKAAVDVSGIYLDPAGSGSFPGCVLLAK